MKFIGILTLFACSLFSTIQASCAYATEKTEGPYVGVIGGGYKANPSLCRPGYYVGGVAGYKFSNNVRLEGEVTYQRFAYKKFVPHVKGNCKSVTCMANALYDFDLNLPFTPYVGAGVGYQHTRFNATHQSQFGKFHAGSKSNDFACQGIAGVKFEIQKGLELGVDYRHVMNVNKHCRSYDHGHRVGLALTQSF